MVSDAYEEIHTRKAVESGQNGRIEKIKIPNNFNEEMVLTKIWFAENKRKRADGDNIWHAEL